MPESSNERLHVYISAYFVLLYSCIMSFKGYVVANLVDPGQYRDGGTSLQGVRGPEQRYTREHREPQCR